MPISSGGSINSATVDGVYVFELTPTPSAGLGVPTDLAGLVGVASWGPLNTPIPFSDTNSLYAAFGKLTTDPNDLVTQGQLASPYGNNFVGVRVCGASTHASVAAAVALQDTVPATGATATAFYTGAEGNNISVTLQTGSNSTTSNPTVTVIVTRAGYPPEIFPNLASSTGGSFWANFVSAINNGLNGVRGPSKLITATIGASTHAPALGTFALTGGANGDALTAGTLTGTDGTPGQRTGMYALRGTGIGQFILCGDTSSTDYPTAVTFAQGEGAVYIGNLPSGQDVNTAIAAKSNANIASPFAVLLHDFVYFYDPVAQTTRSVSPDGVALGVISSLPPEASPSNKPALGVTNISATERTYVGQVYSAADAGALKAAGIAYLGKPIPRGSIFGFANGVNTYMVQGQDGVEYGRFTSYLARSFVSLLGQFVGELQGVGPNDPTRTAAKAVLNQFLSQLLRQNRISAYTVQLDTTNNTQATVQAGYLVANVSVTYMGVAHQIVVNLLGGVTVQVAQGAPLQ